MPNTAVRRLSAFLDCTGVLAVTLALVVLLAGSFLGRWEASALGRPFLEYLVMLTVPVLAMVVTGRSLSGHGLWLADPSYHLGVGFTAVVPYACAHAVGLAVPSVFAPWDQVVQAACMLGALGAVVAMLRKRPSFEPPLAV